MKKEINYEEFRKCTLNAPRLTSLYLNFENIADGSKQVPKKIPKTNILYLLKSKEYRNHDKIFQKNLGIFFKHAISSIPFLSEEILRVDIALYKYAKNKKASTSNPLTYWETSSADGTRGRTLSEYTKGSILTLTDSPNLGNKNQFDSSQSHPYSYFYHGPFVDINSDFLEKQNFNQHFNQGFDIIWENTTFQMYGDNRFEQIAYISQVLKPYGLLILFEKLNDNDSNNYLLMEQLKDKFKSKYFNVDQIVAKKKNILNTMENGQVTKNQLIEATSHFYKYGFLIWNSTNFYEIVASNSKKNIKEFINSLPKPYVPLKLRKEKHMVVKLW